jgi:hypothetical protein
MNIELNTNIDKLLKSVIKGSVKIIYKDIPKFDLLID